MQDFAVLENLLGYSFKSPLLLEKAMAHSSFLNEGNGNIGDSNEKFEFLGDSVLELVVREYSIAKFPCDDIGSISKFKSMIVSDRFLSRIGKSINIGNYLLLGKGEDAAGGRLRDSIIAAALEAIIGAIYLDGGLEQARSFVLKKIIEKAESSEFLDIKDYKSKLQEIVQKDYGTFPVYNLVEETGPVHDKTFRVCLEINKNPIGYGVGKSIKEAEQMAAKEALEKLETK